MSDIKFELLDSETGKFTEILNPGYPFSDSDEVPADAVLIKAGETIPVLYDFGSDYLYATYLEDGYAEAREAAGGDLVVLTSGDNTYTIYDEAQLEEYEGDLDDLLVNVDLNIKWIID